MFLPSPAALNSPSLAIGSGLSQGAGLCSTEIGYSVPNSPISFLVEFGNTFGTLFSRGRMLFARYSIFVTVMGMAFALKAKRNSISGMNYDIGNLISKHNYGNG